MIRGIRDIPEASYRPAVGGCSVTHLTWLKAARIVAISSIRGPRARAAWRKKTILQVKLVDTEKSIKYMFNQ
jgi:hypothetical protein